MSLLDDVLSSTKTKEEIKDVPPLPPGTYFVMLVGPHERIESREKKTPGCEFTFRLLQSREDVNPEALAAHLDASSRSLNDVTIKHTMWESAYLEQQLRDFVYDAAGIDQRLPLNQAIAELPGRNMLMHIVHKPFKRNNGEMGIRAEIASFARAD